MLFETPKWFDKAVDWLVSNRRRLINEYVNNDEQEVDFDYPDYAGMPKPISNKLSPDFVDCVQDFWWSYLVAGEGFSRKDIIQRFIDAGAVDLKFINKKGT